MHGNETPSKAQRSISEFINTWEDCEPFTLSTLPWVRTTNFHPLQGLEEHNCANISIIHAAVQQERNMSRSNARTVFADEWRKNPTLPHDAYPSIVEEDGYARIPGSKRFASAASFMGQNSGRLNRAVSPLAPAAGNRSNLSVANYRSSRIGPSYQSNTAGVYDLPYKAPSLLRKSVMGSVLNGPPDLTSIRVQKLSKELFEPGMIIRALCHEQDFHVSADRSVMTIADKYTTESKFGLIHSKYRKMIVLALYETHYLAIPLYTHNGNGVAHKSKPDEYISVRDHRSSQDFVNQTANGQLVTREINDGIHPLDPKSLAHVTYPLARKYSLPLIVEGYLKDESTKRLWKLFNKFVQETLIK